MGKVTFRADDDLLDRVESLDASKSEVMRAALRAYLDGQQSDGPAASGRGGPGGATVDELIAGRVDELVANRLDELLGRQVGDGGDVNVDVSVEGVGTAGERAADAERHVERAAESDADASDAGDDEVAADPDDAPGASDAPHPAACGQCGTDLAPEHVYCPNCGEKAGGRVFCDCGDELRSDWAFCPACGRRTPAADVLDGA
jgi:hypothetical protein